MEKVMIWHPCGDCANYGNIKCMDKREDCDYAEEGEIVYES